MWASERLSEFVTLFLVINPFGVLPIFLATAGGFTPKVQRKIALQAVIVAFVTLTFFFIAGDFVLTHMKIPIRAFQISGGIVLFLVALEMVRGDSHDSAAHHPGAALALAIYPIGIPKIAGPGPMLAVILLTDDDRYNFAGQVITIGMLAIVLVLTLLVLLAAGPISRLIGTAGTSVIGRIMGMLLAAFAVGMVLSAVAEWLGLPKL